MIKARGRDDRTTQSTRHSPQVFLVYDPISRYSIPACKISRPKTDGKTNLLFTAQMVHNHMVYRLCLETNDQEIEGICSVAHCTIREALVHV